MNKELNIRIFDESSKVDIQKLLESDFKKFLDEYIKKREMDGKRNMV